MSANPVDQTDTFSRDEGDNWFLRNRCGFDRTIADDHIIRMAVALDEQTPLRSICELGCSNGWRLAALRQALPRVERLAGSDVSPAAIEDGRSQWPDIKLAVGSLDRPSVDGEFDLVIVSFVLHWVARERLAASVAGVDALVRDGGCLVLADFLPNRPSARRYHHRSDVEIYTYKQDYRRCFTGLGTYDELKSEIFSHSGETGREIDPQDRAVCSLLRKKLDGYERA